MASCKSAGSFFRVLTEKQSGTNGDGVAGHQDAWCNFIELHGLNASGFVFTRIDHTVLNGVIDLVVGNDGRCHADRARMYGSKWVRLAHEL